jgi:uncharacterized protein YndB with AHSA1/START domain
MTTDQVTVTTLVRATPEEAFTVFTERIDDWWRRGSQHRRGPSIIRFDQGKLVEVSASGAVELGRVQVWEPGARLVIEWQGPRWDSSDQTEVEIRFEPDDSGGTRVTLEHRGWTDLHPGDAASSVIGLWWGDLLAAYAFSTTHAANG